MKRQTGFRFTEKALNWLKEQAQERGISRNSVLQELINEKMEKCLKVDEGRLA